LYKDTFILFAAERWPRVCRLQWSTCQTARHCLGVATFAKNCHRYGRHPTVWL